MNPTTVIPILERLVAFDTTSSNSNVELIHWVANYLKDHGVDAFVQQGDEAGKANLFATIGPKDKPGVMLAGHSDVVPVAGETWASDPFTLTERDGNLYGRGSADMKAYIACFTAMVPHFKAAKLSTPVHLALSYNEETNMGGMRRLATYLAGAPVKPLACIIGEPTMMNLIVANKGAAIFKVSIEGKAVHSSFRDQGISAVEVAAEIIVFINALQRQLNDQMRHDGFEFPHTSVHVGRIAGGTAHNITARHCEFVFEVRALPGIRARDIAQKVRDYCSQTLLPPMRKVSADCDIRIDEVLDAPGMDERGNTYLAKALMPLCPHSVIGRVSFGTEGGILQDVGVPTIVCGPGDIKVAHQPNEFVPIAQLDECVRFLHALTGRLEQGSWPGQLS